MNVIGADKNCNWNFTLIWRVQCNMEIAIRKGFVKNRYFVEKNFRCPGQKRWRGTNRLSQQSEVWIENLTLRKRTCVSGSTLNQRMLNTGEGNPRRRQTRYLWIHLPENAKPREGKKRNFYCLIVRITLFSSSDFPPKLVYFSTI